MTLLGKLKKSFIPADPKRALDAPPGVVRPHVIFDISIGDSPIGQVELELFSDITPRTVENFKHLASGEHEFGGETHGYAGSTFHRVVPGFMIQGGDIVRGDGTGMYSIYKGAFEDENFKVKHEFSGILSMANSGPNTNGCQFFITTAPAEFLDGKHVAFGRVVHGMDVVRAVEVTPTRSDRPVQPVVITNSRVIDSTDSKAANVGNAAAGGAVPTVDHGAGAAPVAAAAAPAGGNPAAPAAATNTTATGGPAAAGTGSAPVAVPGAGGGFSGGQAIKKVPTHTDTSRSPSDPTAPRTKMSVFGDSGGDFADSSPVDRAR